MSSGVIYKYVPAQSVHMNVFHVYQNHQSNLQVGSVIFLLVLILKSNVLWNFVIKHG